MNSDTELSPEERATLDALAQLPPIEPPGDIRERFRERAATEHAVGPAPRRWITVGLVAALVLALGGGWWVDRAREERDRATLREELTTALQDLSAARRVQAIGAASSSPIGDSRILIVAALTESLLSDSSTNVRVAAAEALGRIADPVALRDAAEQSMPTERSPFVQAALLAAATRLPLAERAALVTTLLTRHDLDPVVRAEAELLPRT
jgi:hypothetical protein